MHGCDLRSHLLVNAEVDSMGGVVDGGFGIGIKTSPCSAAIEKAQAELRQEYDVREERRRELEFLEKGGNPLDFRFGNAASVSVQSTSLTDHQTEHFVTSEAKGSVALTASPHGDSVESSGRPGAATVCEPNSADNFNTENEILESKRNPKHPTRKCNIAPSEQSSQMDGTQNAKESEDSAIFRPYARRNRSRPNRDGARSSSTDIIQSSSGQVQVSVRDAKGLISESNHQKDCIIPPASNSKCTTLNADMVSQVEITNSRPNMELDGAHALEPMASPPKSSFFENRLGSSEVNISGDCQHDIKFSEVDDQKMPVDVASGECNHVGGKEQVIAASECPPGEAVAKTEDENGSHQLNGLTVLKREDNEAQHSNCAIAEKGLDSESLCTQNSPCLDAKMESDLHPNGQNDTNGILLKQTSECGGIKSTVAVEMGNEEEDAVKENDTFLQENQSGNDTVLQTEEEAPRIPDEFKCSSNFKGADMNDHAASEGDKRPSNALGDNSISNEEIIGSGVPQSSADFSNKELHESSLCEKNSSVATDPQSYSNSHQIGAEKAHEDSILEEAWSIEAKRKRIAELPVGIVPPESHRKSHWDFVLEEMTWLANDFAQERLWKLTAAAQISHRVAFSSRLRVEEQNQHWKLKRVASTMAQAVMQFWHSAEMLINKDDQIVSLKSSKHDSRSLDGESSKNKFGEVDKETQSNGKNLTRLIQGYAVRFLKCNSSPVPCFQANASETPESLADSGIVGTSWEDCLTEESLFYAVPSGAMETYRLSIESHLMQCEKTGSDIQEEVDTSMYDATSDFGYRDNACGEEDGETNNYYLHGGFEGNRSTKHKQNKKKNLKYPTDSPYGTYSAGCYLNASMGKRPASNLHVGPIPTKRVRTTPRLRFINPFTAGQTPAKTDASSGDTSSFQDDQSTLHGGSQVQKGMEVESVVEQLSYDCAETSTKPKKKRESKHLVREHYHDQEVSAHEGWLLDSTVHNEQRDNAKKRLESPHFDSNGTSGLYGQHIAKKQKIMKQSLDCTYDNMAQSVSIPSPVTSQMSNMPGTNKVVKLIVGRDRGRKPKVIKVPTGPQGPGSPWSLFEDQALVVLVHDMGPNWELVSDVINSTLQFKCIFRKPKECKERHKILMDKNGGDDYDSADDSRTSQSYPSTLPGIPKGSARQLFQRLQGPMEEDTIKSHFEKIIMIGKKYRCRSQNDDQDLKQIVAVHSSHILALNEVSTNQNGGVLTPLDLCDATAASPDVISSGYKSSHGSGLPLANQSAVGSGLSTSGVNSSLQVSPGVVLGNNSSPSGLLNAPIRDGRHSVPRTTLPVNEQQRMQHYNQMLSNRNLQHPNFSVTGALSGADCGMRMISGGNPVGVMPGMNRSMPQPRPGFQGMTTSSMLNSGSMLSSGVVGMPSPVSMQSASGSAQGNSMMRSREGLHIMRTGHNSEHQRQMMAPELQMQVTQANSQGIPAFSGPSSTPPSVQAYPGHSQQQNQIPPQQSHVMTNPHLQGTNHTAGSQQQAYAIRIAKERQMKHRLLQQQQQQQFAASGAVMSHVQSPSQLPISSSVQNSPQIQPQTSSQAVPMPPLVSSSPMTPMSVQPQQQKHTLPHHGINRNSQTVTNGLTNQMGKQRPRLPHQNQQLQQSGRSHPPQRQHSQSSQQAKLLKGMGRGNMVGHQNPAIDHSPLNGLSLPPGNQNADKGEHIMHLMQGQSLYSGSGLNSVPTTKPLVTPPTSNHSQPQQKLFSAAAPPSSKSLSQMPAHADPSSQGQVPSVPSGHSFSPAYQALPAAVMASNHQHLQPQPQTHQKQSGHTQPIVHRMLQQNRQLNSDMPIKSQTDQGNAEQKPLSNVPQMGASMITSVSQACNDAASTVPVVSSTVASQWKASEPSSDSASTNSTSQLCSISSPPFTNSVGSERVSYVNPGLGQRQLSGGLPQLEGAGAQRQQQQPPPPQAAPLPPQNVSQQRLQPQEQQAQQEQQSPRQLVPLQQHTQQNTQHHQSGHGSLYIRPTNSQME